MSIVTIMKTLEATNSRLSKENIVAKVIGTADEYAFFDGAKLALSSYVTFGIRQIPERTGPDGPGLKYDDFALITTGFSNRSLTGNAARDTVAKMMAKATNDEWNHWYRRILIKDLRCGVSDKTINKVCKTAKRKDLMVPVFSCQLAKDSEGVEPTGDKAIEVKLDGMRVLTVVYPNKDTDDLTIIKTNGLSQVEQFSRNGKELHNFKTILDEIAKVGYIFNEPMVLDGEVMSASFQDLMKQAHRKRDVDTKDAILHLFDIITLKDFKAGKSNVKQIHRRRNLENFFTVMGDKLTHVELLGQEIVDMDTAKGKARFREINADAIARGYEGIMIKDLDSPYECKRTDSWEKMKPFIEVSLNIVAFEEGTGKNVGKLGAFVCEGVDAGKMIRVNVGSGFSDKQRDEYWQNRSSLLNDVVEVRADAVTQNQEGDYSLRFPRFKTFRGFDPGEKI